MKTLLVLGSGTAGTMVANKLRDRLAVDEWTITVVDQDDAHHYQPGYLFVPFGHYTRDKLVRTARSLLKDGIEFVLAAVTRVTPETNTVTLVGGRKLRYDYLVVATGTSPRPDQTPGMLGPEWRRSIFDFYTLDGAEALAAALKSFDHGQLVIHIAEMPIKCPVAPLEFAFLADDWLRNHGVRDQVEMVFVTPLDAAFTQPVAAELLGGMLDERKIRLTPDFMVESIDNEHKTLVSYDGREVAFDLLVTIPVNMGADFIGTSGLGDELNYVPVDKHTLLSIAHANIFALGDASNAPASKAGSVAHFAVDIFVDNFLEHIAGRPMTGSFDGHANCFVEAGDNKALLIDFNYDTQPLPGKYPVPGIGPMSLLKATRTNHLGKLAFRHLYWNVLLPGHPVPLPSHMSMAGKHQPDPEG
ncbi:MAG: FAD/NAD(P)-binding oxidoreductase [Nocardioides sp.]|uniref:type III sulfide quinone reductase, selenoprotein subtype n=1 Tax=Nocardioides sp. TaxID=35761 RepID=UPI003266E9D4